MGGDHSLLRLVGMAAVRKGGNLFKVIMGIETETGLGGDCLRHLSLMLIPGILGKCPCRSTRCGAGGRPT